MNSRIKFAVSGSFYFFVLLVSFLLAFFYPFFTPYGWFLIPVVANFFVGYLVREVDEAIKIIVACFFIHAGIVIGLLNVSPVYDAFSSWFYELPPFLPISSRTSPADFMLILIPAYTIMHLTVGIGVSFVGTTVRDHISRLLKRSVKVKFLFVMGMLLLIGVVSTHFSSDSYRVLGEPLRYVPPKPSKKGYTINLISCGFPLPYFHLTNSSAPARRFGIQPFNHTNFILDILFYTGIYSIITAFVKLCAQKKKQRPRWQLHAGIGLLGAWLRARGIRTRA